LAAVPIKAGSPSTVTGFEKSAWADIAPSSAQISEASRMSRK
jgi:hypothetical protein